MKKFVIIEHEPLTVRLEKIWNIDELQQNGVDVEYWDLSTLVYPGIFIPDRVKNGKVHEVDTMEKLSSLVASNDVNSTVYAVELFCNWSNRKIFSLLHYHKCNCVRIDLYANTTLPTSFTKRLFNFLKKLSFRSLYEKIMTVLYYKTWLRGKLYSGTLSSSTLARPDIKINHPDYERFKLDEAPLLSESYILFIDVYYPYHPDLKYYFKINNITAYAESYQRTMRLFFDYLTKKYKKEVVIAAHPKSNYQGNEYGNRKIIKNQTCNLIKYADLIVTHESNSLSYIALSGKPFAITYPESYNNVQILKNYVEALAKYCGKEAYNLDKCKWNNINFSTMSESVRIKYIYNNLTSKETENKNNVDIWVKKILN